MTAYPLLAAVVWAACSRGGTSGRDLAVVMMLVVAGNMRRSNRPVPRATYVAIIALLSWEVLEATLRTGLELESVRLPVLLTLVTLVVRGVALLDTSGRESLLTGLIALGCLQGIVALAALVSTAGGLRAPMLGERAASLIGSPNALGILLVSTSCVTARAIEHTRSRVFVAALGLQSVTILLTASRTAIGVAVVVLAVFVWSRRPAFQWLVVASVGASLGVAVIAARFALNPRDERPHLWLTALRRIAANPLVGEGPVTQPFTRASPASRATTHAHDEILQFTLEYGLIGLALAVVVLVLAFRDEQGTCRTSPGSPELPSVCG